MRYLLNGLYLLSLLLLSPWLLYKVLTTGKYRRGLWAKLSGRGPHLLSVSRPRAWFHGVSVGEIHLLRQVMAGFRRRHPDWECVISTTTDTGFDEARKWFPDLAVFFWPFDFSWAVHRALRRVDPDLIVLAEGELWPNFLAAAQRRGVPVVVINGRMSPRSLRRYGRLRFLARGLWRRISLFAVQTEEYAAAFRALGAPHGRVHVTGSVKYDGIEMDRHNPRTRELRRLLAVRPDELVWVAGSTQAPEEEIVLAIFRRLREQHPNLRLILVPRQKERFDAVADLLRRSGEPFQRRSAMRAVSAGISPSVTLVDTFGELGALWGLADVAFVGGSLDGRRGGQNMIEPAAYGATVLFGPHVWNFRDTADSLVRTGAAVRVAGADELESAVRRLLNDPAERARRGEAARRLVASQQGAIERTLDLLDQLPGLPSRQPRAA
jgi:3-deoxy-D-manno-octulosonic-acid transferase